MMRFSRYLCGLLKINILLILPVNFLFSDDISKIALSICRKTIEYYITTGEKIQFSNLPDIFKEKIPVFVSLRKGTQTRGCAGTFFTDRSFVDNLIEFSIIAATRDFRNRIIDKEELKDIRIQITIPDRPVEIKSLDCYNPEKEGLIVENGSKSGVVLPREAKTSEYAFRMCVRNAGIDTTQSFKLLKFKAKIFIEEGK